MFVAHECCSVLYCRTYCIEGAIPRDVEMISAHAVASNSIKIGPGLLTWSMMEACIYIPRTAPYLMLLCCPCCIMHELTFTKKNSFHFNITRTIQHKTLCSFYPWSINIIHMNCYCHTYRFRGCFIYNFYSGRGEYFLLKKEDRMVSIINDDSSLQI